MCCSRSRHWCWFLSLVLTLQPVLVIPHHLGAQEPDKQVVQESTPEDLAELVRTLKAAADPKAMRAALDVLDKRSSDRVQPDFDVSAMADQLGRDIPVVFSFVRDKVRYEAYEGVLRGARGALMARAGNAFDKSLLLAALLTRHGIEVRFARGRLSHEQSETLIAQMFRLTNQPELPEPQSEHLTAAPLPVPDEFRSASEAFMNLNTARWLSSARTVGRTLQEADIAISSRPPVPRTMLVEEASDHLWVEYRQKDQWIPLDPSFRKAMPGLTYARPEAVFETLPAPLHHKVLIRLKLEERDGTNVTTRDVLRFEAAAADLHGAAVSLSHGMTTTTADWTAQPVLTINEKELRGEKFSGPVGGFAGGVAALGNRLFNKPKPEGGITAMWLDFEFVYPSARTEVVRRELFDRIGIAARQEKREASAKLSPLPSNGIPNPLTGASGLSFSSGALNPGLVMKHFSSAIPTIRSALAVPSGEDQQNPSAADMRRLFLGTLSFIAQSWHLQSQASIQATRKAGIWSGIHFYEATPRLAIVNAFRADEKPDATLNLNLDLRKNSLRAVGDKASGSEIVWANVTRGVMDGSLEHVMFVDMLSGTEAASSTIGIFEVARTSGVGVKEVTTPNEVATLDVSAEAKARLQAGLAEHVVLIIPERALSIASQERVAWWRVDLESGETVAILDNGLNGAQVSTEWSFFLAATAGSVIALLPWVAVFVYWTRLATDTGYNQGFNEGYRRAMEDRMAYERLTGYVPPTRDEPGRAPQR